MKAMNTIRSTGIIALRCSSALCFLLLPSYLVDQQRLLNSGKRRYNPLLLGYGEQKKVIHQPQQRHAELIPHRPIHIGVSSTSSLNLATPTILWQNTSDIAKNSDDDANVTNIITTDSLIEQNEESRLSRLRGNVREKMKSLARRTKSIIGKIKSLETTEMEAAVLEDSLVVGLPGITVIAEDNETDSFPALEEAEYEDSLTAVSTSSSSSSSFSSPSLSMDLPKGSRWAIANPTTDLSGTWRPIITDDFKRQYDEYLTNCGTTYVFRKVCLNFCSSTREQIEQQDQGRVLKLTGSSPAGTWKRSLLSSGADGARNDFQAVQSEFLDPDKELVKAESWWEDEGRVLKSFLRGKPGVDGGEFESQRYLEIAEDGTVVLVCESTFHPSPRHLQQSDSKFKPAHVQWRYQKV